MTAYNSNEVLRMRLSDRGIIASNEQAGILRRAEKTLHRWAELECGDGNNYASWAIERDETTDRPIMVTYPHHGKSYRRAIPDRERGALLRVSGVCNALGIHFYHQTDPRGCALYVSNESMDDTNYNRGTPCSV